MEALSALTDGLLEPFLFESSFNGTPKHRWMAAHPEVPALSTAFYVLMLVALKMIMKNKEALSLRWPFALWNLMLSIFSFFCLLRIGEFTIREIMHNGWISTICRDPEEEFGQGASGLWIWLFIVSKIPEYTDTFFLLLKKKDVIFLHWFHHITVAILCWVSYTEKSAASQYFAVMNSLVHFVMYMYYFLQIAGLKPRWGKAVTILQILQMVAGVNITIISAWVKRSVSFRGGDICYVPDRVEQLSLVIYISYLILFVQFYRLRYRKPKQHSKKKTS